MQRSRSPSVVTVGLQLPESEAGNAPNGRLVDKFPSTTTLWLVLRKFEAGVAGNGSTRNLTARGVPVTGAGGGASATGRLYYEIPVLRAMEREFSSFTDLQKSLAQLGFNSGNILLRLSFRTTEEPLEEAMVKIGDYFKSLGEDEVNNAQGPSSSATTATALVNNAPSEPIQRPKEPSLSTDDGYQTAIESTQPAQSASPTPAPAPPLPESYQVPPPAHSRPITVFSPPKNSTPLSAQTSYNENDYTPSIEQAQAYQKRLNESSRNVRLPTDAEIAAKSAAEQEKIANITSVDVKIRLPDQSQVVSKFGNRDTGKSLYDFVRTCLVEPLAAEKFTITFSPNTVGPGAAAARKIQTVVPESDRSLLIKDLGMTGRVLVNVSWDASASAAARESKANLLKPELRSQAQEHKVEQPPDIPEEHGGTLASAGSGSSNDAAGSRGEGRPRRTGALPKWLKLPGKK